MTLDFITTMTVQYLNQVVVGLGVVSQVQLKSINYKYKITVC